MKTFAMFASSTSDRECARTTTSLWCCRRARRHTGKSAFESSSSTENSTRARATFKYSHHVLHVRFLFRSSIMVNFQGMNEILGPIYFTFSKDNEVDCRRELCARARRETTTNLNLLLTRDVLVQATPRPTPSGASRTSCRKSATFSSKTSTTTTRLASVARLQRLTHHT